MSEIPDTEAEVCKDILERQKLGIAKYGVTVAQNPLSEDEWLWHHYTELLDAAVYVRRRIQMRDKAKEDAKKKGKP